MNVISNLTEEAEHELQKSWEKTRRGPVVKPVIFYTAYHAFTPNA